MLAIAACGSPDHLTETGVVANSTAPTKVAPIKSIFRIVVLLHLALLILGIRSFADAVWSELHSEHAAGATSHDRNRTNDKRHKVYNRRDARQPPTALTALGVGQTISGSWSVPSRLIEVDEPFFAQGCHTTFGAHSTHRTRASWLRQLAALYVHVGCGVDEARRILRAVLFSQLSIMARACNSASLRDPMTTLPFISTPAG
jgi:hypothetical protein